MANLQTRVNQEKLEEWCGSLPECEIFLANFFGSCQPYTLDINRSNYNSDVQAQMKITPSWRKYKDQLDQSFVEITQS